MTTHAQNFQTAGCSIVGGRRDADLEVLAHRLAVHAEFARDGRYAEPLPFQIVDQGDLSQCDHLPAPFAPGLQVGRFGRRGFAGGMPPAKPRSGAQTGDFSNGTFGEITLGTHSRAPDDYTRACFKQYGLLTDKSGWYGSMWRPFHLIGLETSVSVLSAVLRGEPTGSSKEYRGDAVATAKTDLKAGDMLDGEGGFAVWAKAIPARISQDVDALPIGLAHNVKLTRPVAKDQIVRMSDVELVNDLDVVDLRKEQVKAMAPIHEAA